MNEQNNTQSTMPAAPVPTPAPTPTPTPTATAPTAPQKPHMSRAKEALWFVILIGMGLGLAAVMYYMYKKSMPDYKMTTKMNMVQETTNTMQSTTAPESSGSVEQDSKMKPSEVTNDVINEIDSIQNSDDSDTTFGDNNVNDLQ